MKHKQKTKNELILMAMAKSMSKKPTVEDLLNATKRDKSDKAIIMAHYLALGLFLYQLWQHDGWTPEELQLVVKIHNDFRDTVERGNPEDLNAVSEMLADLQAYMGYNVLTGEVKNG